MLFDAHSSDENKDINKNVLSSDEESEIDNQYQNKKKTNKQNKSKRSTSKTRFISFRSSNKIGTKKKENIQQKLSSDEDSDLERVDVVKEMVPRPQLQNNSGAYNKIDELTSSKAKYAKLAEKALNEMSQFTSEDEDALIQKKRQHLVKSLKKEYPRQSKRLENML